MRFLRHFFSFILVLAIVTIGGWFLFREAWLMWAENQVLADIRFLQRTNSWSGTASSCLDETGTPAVNIQLRFLNNQEYVLEVACEDARYFAWSEVKKLPWKVIKTTGSAGFVVPIDERTVNGEITLSFWDQNKLLSGSGSDVKVKWGKSKLVSESLISSCMAHGLTCCDLESEVGVGDVFSRAVNDCQSACFSACSSRPNLLFFQSDPPADATTRQVTLDRNNTFVLFNFTVEQSDRPIKQVVIDYGDGTSEVFKTYQGKATKQFDCDQPECRYTVQITAMDEGGVSSADQRISQLEIVIQ